MLPCFMFTSCVAPSCSHSQSCACLETVFLPLAEWWGCNQWWRANYGSPWCDGRFVQATPCVGTWHCSEITHKDDSGKQVSAEWRRSKSFSINIHLAVLSMWLEYLPRCGVHQETSQNTAGSLRSVALRPGETLTLIRISSKLCSWRPNAVQLFMHAWSFCLNLVFLHSCSYKD